MQRRRVMRHNHRRNISRLRKAALDEETGTLMQAYGLAWAEALTRLSRRLYFGVIPGSPGGFYSEPRIAKEVQVRPESCAHEQYPAQLKGLFVQYVKTSVKGGCRTGLFHDLRDRAPLVVVITWNEYDRHLRADQEAK